MTSDNDPNAYPNAYYFEIVKPDRHDEQRVPGKGWRPGDTEGTIEPPADVSRILEAAGFEQTAPKKTIAERLDEAREQLRRRHEERETVIKRRPRKRSRDVKIDIGPIPPRIDPAPVLAQLRATHPEMDWSERNERFVGVRGRVAVSVQLRPDHTHAALLVDGESILWWRDEIFGDDAHRARWAASAVIDMWHNAVAVAVALAKALPGGEG